MPEMNVSAEPGIKPQTLQSLIGQSKTGNRFINYHKQTATYLLPTMYKAHHKTIYIEHTTASSIALNRFY